MRSSHLWERVPSGISRGVVALAALMLLGVGLSTSPAAASAVTSDGTGSASVSKHACIKQGTDDARRKALVKRITSIMGGYDAARFDALLAEASDFVTAQKVRSTDFSQTGFCKVTASFRFDDQAIEEAVKSVSTGGGRVGVVLRYIVDGRLADASGHNPLEAVRALERELQKYNCRLVNLLFEQDQFSQRMQEKMRALTGNDDEPDAVYDRGLSHAETVRNALRAFRQELQRSLGFGKEGFDRVVSGEITIRHVGKDPDSENQIAAALVTLTLHDVLTQNPLRPTRPIPVRAGGVDRETARVLAMTSGLESAVQDLNSIGSICSS